MVTAFSLPVDYLQKYPVQNVGGKIHEELWVPSEELEDFNSHIISRIEILKVFIGKQFDASKNDEATRVVLNYKETWQQSD